MLDASFDRLAGCARRKAGGLDAAGSCVGVGVQRDCPALFRGSAGRCDPGDERRPADALAAAGSLDAPIAVTASKLSSCRSPSSTACSRPGRSGCPGTGSCRAQSGCAISSSSVTPVLDQGCTKPSAISWSQSISPTPDARAIVRATTNSRSDSRLRYRIAGSLTSSCRASAITRRSSACRWFAQGAPGRRLAAAGQDEVLERRQVGVEPSSSFSSRSVWRSPIISMPGMHNSPPRSNRSCWTSSSIEPRSHSRDLRNQHADCAVELVDRAVGFHPQAVLLGARSVAQPGRAVVTGAGIDFRKAIAHFRSMTCQPGSLANRRGDCRESESGVRSQESGVRSQESESGVGSRKSVPSTKRTKSEVFGTFRVFSDH